MTVVSFSDAYRARHGQEPTVLVTKARLAQMFGKSPRWVELRMADGAPWVWDGPQQYRKLFDPREFAEWLESRAA